MSRTIDGADLDVAAGGSQTGASQAAAPARGDGETGVTGSSGPGGVAWTLDAEADLNANLVILPPGGEIGAHVNGELDVLVVVLAGSGLVRVDDDSRQLARHSLVLLPRGARRAIEAGPAGLRYLTVHRRRGGLTIGGRRGGQPTHTPDVPPG
jgi:quercetin dioxygenase-like cupin family protein